VTLSFGPQKSAGEGVVVLACQGKIVAGREGSELRVKVQELLKYSPNVVLDLGEINYIDSSGLGVLVSLYSTARAAGGQIKFENLVTPVTYTRPASLVS